MKRYLFSLTIGFVLIACSATSAVSQSEIKNCNYVEFAQLAAKGKTKKLRKFLDSHPDHDVDCRPEGGNTALMLAVDKRRPKIVDMLLELGADPNVRNGYGITPFLLASQNRNYGNNKYNFRPKLIAAGADIHAVDNGGYNAFLYGALKNDTSHLRELRNLGIDIHHVNNEGSNARDIVEFLGRYHGRQANPNMGDENRRYYNVLSFLEAEGIQSSVPFSGVKVFTDDQVEDTSIQPKASTSRKPGALERLLNAGVVKSQGTGRKCNHVLVIGNFSGVALYGEIQAKLENGRFQRYGEMSGGKFQLPAGGIAKHQIWLTQGGGQRLALSAGGSSSRADYIDFEVPIDCPHGDRSLSSRSFGVEKDNRNDSISIFEDTDGDGRRDKTDVQNMSSSSDVSGSECTKLDVLAMSLSDDLGSLKYDDSQIVSLYTAMNCEMSDAISEQRNVMTSVLAGN